MDKLTPEQINTIQATFGWVPRARVRQRLLYELLAAVDEDELTDALYDAYEEAEEAGARLRLTRKLTLEGDGGLSVWGRWDYTLRLGRRALCSWRVNVSGEGQQFGSGLWIFEGDPSPEPPVALHHLDELGVEATGGRFPEDLDAARDMVERHQSRTSS